jgi:hypothetical protein
MECEPERFQMQGSTATGWYMDSGPVTKERYLHQAQFALFGCQMVEEALKSFLMYARDINRFSSCEFIQIDKSDEELDETPLGGLIVLFRKVLPNSQLNSRLETLRPERNHCAHRALVLCFMSDVCINVSLDAEFERMQKTRELAWSCVEDLKPALTAAESRFEALRG